MGIGFIADRSYREQKIQSWVSVGLLVFISSFIWAPSRDGLEAVYLLAFFIPLLCVFPWRKPEFHRYGGWFSVWGLLFGIYAASTTVWAPISNVGFFVYQWLILAFWLCGTSWLASDKKINIEKILNLLVWVGAIGSVVNMVVFYWHQPFIARLEGWSVTRNPNSIGSIFGVIALFAYINWLRATTSLQTLLSFLYFLLVTLSLILSQSRASWVGFLILVPFCFWWCKPSKGKIIFHLLAIFSFVLCALYFWNLISEVIFERGDSFRTLIWCDVLQRSIEDHALFGQGLEKAGRIIIPDVDVFNHAHNAWLDTFYRTGLVGLILQLIVFFYVLRYFSLSPRLFPLFIWLFFGVIYSFVDSRGFFWQIDVKWFCYWLPVGLIGALVSASYQGNSTVENK